MSVGRADTSKGCLEGGTGRRVVSLVTWCFREQSGKGGDSCLVVPTSIPEHVNELHSQDSPVLQTSPRGLKGTEGRMVPCSRGPGIGAVYVRSWEVGF